MLLANPSTYASAAGSRMQQLHKIDLSHNQLQSLPVLGLFVR